MLKDRRKYPSFELGVTFGSLIAVITDIHNWLIILGILAVVWVLYLVQMKLK